MPEVYRRIGKSADRKFRLVMQSYGLKGSELGAFLRSNGIYSDELNDWRNQMSDGLSGNMMMNVDTKKSQQKKIEKLERELKEARIIIELQKKVQKILEDEEQSTLQKSDTKSSNLSKKPKP